MLGIVIKIVVVCMAICFILAGFLSSVDFLLYGMIFFAIDFIFEILGGF